MTRYDTTAASPNPTAAVVNIARWIPAPRSSHSSPSASHSGVTLAASTRLVIASVVCAIVAVRVPQPASTMTSRIRLMPIEDGPHGQIVMSAYFLSFRRTHGSTSVPSDLRAHSSIWPRSIVIIT